MRKLKTLILTALFAICGGFHAFAQTDGEYYLFDVKNNLFFSRGAAWGTEASVDKYGIPFTWNSENGSLQFKDNDLYLFNSEGTSLYTDNQSTGFYFTETTDGYYLQDKVNNTYVTFSTGGYGYYAHRTTEVGDAIVWQLKTKAERDAIVANYVNENYENVIEAAGIEATSENFLNILATNYAQKDMTSAIGTAKFAGNVGDWTYTHVKRNNPTYGTNYCEMYQGTGTLTQTITGLAKGIYKVTVQGFERAASYQKCNTLGAEGYEISTTVFIANSEQTALKSWYSDKSDTQNPDNTDQAIAKFNAGKYLNELYVYVGEDGILKISIDKRAHVGANWVLFNNFTLTYFSDTVSDEDASALLSSVPTGKMNPDIQTELDNAKTTFEANKTIVNYNTLAAAIQKANQSANIYKGVNEYLTKMKAILDNTNVYTAASYKTYYQDIKDRYDSSTLDETADAVYTANSAYSTGWHSANYIDDILLSTWTIGGESASNYDKKLYINTWSIEGNTDGSEFLAPFFEYWVEDEKSLAANTIVSTITGLEANTNYSFTIRARVRQTNEKTKIANGITMKVGEGEAVDISAGAQFNAGQYYIGNFSAMGETDAEGNLTVTITVAENSNISWLSFYNCKYSEGEDLSAYIADYEFALNNLKAIAGKPVDPNYVSEISEAITEYSTVDNTNKEALIAAKEAIDAVLEKVNPSIAALAGSAITSWTTTTNNGKFEVNTWSTEGSSDGSGMTTPFMQNWIAKGTTLGDATMSYTLENQKAGYYKVTGLVRVLDESNIATPAGVFLSANDAIERAYGANATACTNGVYGNPVVYGLVGDDGKLTISIKIINTNVNWISWKNLSVEYIGESLTQDIADNLTGEARVFANDPVAKATQADAIAALSTLSDVNYIAAAKAIEAAYKAEDRDVVDYSQLQTAFDNFEVKENLGFEEGEYAPYTNATLLKAYADAAAMLKDETAITQEEANDLASTLSNLTWVANTEEVNAVANGDFSNTPSAAADFYKTGWVRTNAWGQIRSDATLASAGYAYYNGGGSLTYGNSELPGYTMPLKANTVYQLSFKYAKWDKETTITASVLNANNEGLSALSYTPTARYDADFPTATVLFKTGEAGNYVLTLAGTQNYVVSDVVIKKAVAEDLTINEGETYTPTEKYANVTFNRTLVEGWNGLVLPFDMTIDDFKTTFNATAVKAFSGITEGADFVTLSFEDATEIKAGVPVMVKAAAGTEYTINNVFVPATGLQTVAKEDGNAKFVFTGTYAPTTLTEVSFVLINGTKYYYHEAGTTATTANAFRGYFVDESTSAAKSVIFDFNEATGIESINTIGDNTENGVVYDLQGRRVIKPSKGIYVTNGKKVVIK